MQRADSFRVAPLAIVSTHYTACVGVSMICDVAVNFTKVGLVFIMVCVGVMVPTDLHANQSGFNRLSYDTTSFRTVLPFLNIDFWNFQQTKSSNVVGLSINHRLPSGLNFEGGVDMVGNGEWAGFPQTDHTASTRGFALDIRTKVGYSLVLHNSRNQRLRGLLSVLGGYRRANFSSWDSDDGYSKASLAHMVEGGVAYEIHMGRKTDMFTVRLSSHLNKAFYSYIFEDSWVRGNGSIEKYRHGFRVAFDVGFSVKDLFDLD